MPARYFLFAEPSDVKIAKNILREKGYRLHEKNDTISEHFHLERLTIYLEIRKVDNLVKNAVDFEGDEGEREKLEEIILLLNAKKVVDSIGRDYTVSFIKDV